MRTTFTFLVTLLLSLLASSNAAADAITFTLTTPNQTAAIGSAPLTFTGTLSNPTSTEVFINGDNFLIDPNLTLDDTPFLPSAPVSLASFGSAGDSSGTIDLFTVTLPTTLTPGTYQGTFSILGGADTGSFDTLATQTFTIDATQSVSAVPEPGTVVLLASGLALFARCRKKLLDS